MWIKTLTSHHPPNDFSLALSKWIAWKRRRISVARTNLLLATLFLLSSSLCSRWRDLATGIEKFHGSF